MLDALVKDDLGLPDFRQGGNHRKHDLDRPVGRGAKDSPELGFKYLGTLQAEADGAKPQEGIAFLERVQVGEKFVAAQVQRP